jgi:hypothetical protein
MENVGTFCIIEAYLMLFISRSRKLQELLYAGYVG